MNIFNEDIDKDALPGSELDSEKMPGHWLLARLGKRVLRPGGLELTRDMLAALRIMSDDEVVEFAPGLGVTTQLVLERHPYSFTAVERDEKAAKHISKILTGVRQQCVLGRAEETGLDDDIATVVFGEAMLSMQTPKGKKRIISEAKRILKPGGRYGIHELGLQPDTLSHDLKEQIEHDLSKAIHVGARPLTMAEWSKLLEEEGFKVVATFSTPMHLLEPARLIKDEGLSGAARFAFNVARNRKAQRRVFKMRKTFTKYQDYLAGVALVAEYQP